MFARSITRMPVNTIKARLLSSQGASALRKLQDVMQEYRLANYTQETPLRFKKEVVAAAKDSNDQIVMASMQKVLQNIGASQKMTPEELRLIFAEIGDKGAIPAERMVKLL